MTIIGAARGQVANSHPSMVWLATMHGRTERVGLVLQRNGRKRVAEDAEEKVRVGQGNN